MDDGWTLDRLKTRLIRSIQTREELHLVAEWIGSDRLASGHGSARGVILADQALSIGEPDFAIQHLLQDIPSFAPTTHQWAMQHMWRWVWFYARANKGRDRQRYFDKALETWLAGTHDAPPPLGWIGAILAVVESPEEAQKFFTAGIGALHDLTRCD